MRRQIANVSDLTSVTETQRHRIVTMLRNNPLTAAQIARRLAVPRTRVYYHLSILERHGFVELAPEPAGTRRYLATANNFIVDRPALSRVHGEEALNQAQADILRAAAADCAELLDGSHQKHGETVMVGRTFLRLSPSALARMRERLAQLFYELDNESQAGGELEVELLMACFPIKSS